MHIQDDRSQLFSVVHSSAGIVFPLRELMIATEEKSTARLLGEGGYGSVYKGVLRHTTVAVKFLNKVMIATAIIIPSKISSLLIGRCRIAQTFNRYAQG
jgi:hypothetical protein